MVTDLAADESSLEVRRDGGVVRFDSTAGFSRGDWDVSTVTRTVPGSNPTSFVVHAELDADEGDRRVAARTWDLSIPRDGV